MKLTWKEVQVSLSRYEFGGWMTKNWWDMRIVPYVTDLALVNRLTLAIIRSKTFRVGQSSASGWWFIKGALTGKT